MPVLIGKTASLQHVVSADTLVWVPQTSTMLGGGGGSTVVASTQVAVSSLAGFVDITPAIPAANDYLPVRLTDGAGFLAPSTTVAVSTGSVRVHQSSAADLNVTVSGYVAPSTTVTVSTGSVRVHQSTAADLNVTVAGYSTVMSVSTGSVRVHQSTAADLNVTVAGYSTIVSVSTGSVRVHQSTAGDLLATVSPASGSTWSVRPIQSSAADLQMTATPMAGSTWNVRPIQSSRADLNVTAWSADNLGNLIESSTRSNAASTMRGLAVRSVMPDCTNASGFSSAVGDLSLLSSNSQSIYVYGFTVTKYSSVVNVLRFLSGSTVQAYYVSASGINGGGTGSTGVPGLAPLSLFVSPPSYLFKTSTGNALILSRSSSGHFSYGVHAWREG